MKPPKKGFSTYPRPLYKFALDAIPSTDVNGVPYIAPEVASVPEAFQVPGLTLTYLYHAGSAWAISGLSAVPSSDESFLSNQGFGCWAYQAHPISRPWGRSGRLIRSPRTVVVCFNEVFDYAWALMPLISDTLTQAGASCVIVSHNYREWPLTEWAPLCSGYQKSPVGSPYTNSPVPVETWYAGDLLACVCSALPHFGYVNFMTVDQYNDDGYSGAGWSSHTVPGETTSTVIVNDPLITATQSFWPDLEARCARFSGHFFYGSSQFFTPDNNIPYGNGYSDTDLWNLVTSGLPWSRHSTAMSDLSASGQAAAVAPGIIAQIEAFWPDEFD